MGVTRHKLQFFKGLIVALTILCAQYSMAAVLPEDRSDILFHNYDGDGSTFKGPSLLVRKQFKNTISAWANYYIDMNTTASIDVVTQSSITRDSPFEEERTEYSVGMDYLYNKTIMSASFKNSSENDYEADNFSLGISQDFFGSLSTVTMGYSKGDDQVFRNRRDGRGKGDIIGREFVGPAEHQRFSIGWSQILTRSWILGLTAETSIDEGILRNPYRSVWFLDAGDPQGQRSQFEVYPETRNSQAYAVKSMYYLPWRASLKLEYRFFEDSWAIEASNYEIKLAQPYKEDWVFELRYRHYEQTQAYFYREIYDYESQFQFMASDKELSTFQNNTIGFGVTYEMKPSWAPVLDRMTLNLFMDRVTYEYDNFLDKRASLSGAVLPGDEPTFAFDATITRFFISVWY